MKISRALYFLFKKQKEVMVFEKRDQYRHGYDIEITKTYAKEKRHPKMPNDYVVLVIPK
jgi:hypothetical protein